MYETNNINKYLQSKKLQLSKHRQTIEKSYINDLQNVIKHFASGVCMFMFELYFIP